MFQANVARQVFSLSITFLVEAKS